MRSYCPHQVGASDADDKAYKIRSERFGEISAFSPRYAFVEVELGVKFRAIRVDIAPEIKCGYLFIFVQHTFAAAGLSCIGSYLAEEHDEVAVKLAVV